MLRTFCKSLLFLLLPVKPVFFLWSRSPGRSTSWKQMNVVSGAWLGKGQEEEKSLMKQLCPYPFCTSAWNGRLWVIKIWQLSHEKGEKVLSQFSGTIGPFSVLEKPLPSPKAFLNPVRKKQQPSRHRMRYQPAAVSAMANQNKELSASR